MNIPDLLSLPNWILDSNVIAVAMTDMDGNYIYVNKHFHERFSWLSNDLIGKPSLITIHPDDREKCQEAVNKCIMHPGSFVPIEIRKPIGGSDNYEWTKWEFSLFKTKDEVPVGILCIGHDITDTKHLASEVADKKGLIFDITYAQSHEVRGPLATMKGLVELLLSNGVDNQDLMLKYIGYLKESLDKLDGAIKKVVDMGGDDITK